MAGPAKDNLSHEQIQQAVARELQRLWAVVTIEQPLSTGVRADIYAINGRLRLIVECKTNIKYSIIETAFFKYAKHCDYLAIATRPQRQSLIPTQSLITWPPEKLDRVGIWYVFPGKIIKHRPALPLLK